MFRTMLVLVLLMLGAGGARAGLYADTDFGDAGFVDVDLDTAPLYRRPQLAVLPDRRIVAALLPLGEMPRSPQLKLVRLLPDGSRDPGFGGGGVATVPLSALAVDYGTVNQLRLLADGRFLALVSTMRIERPPGGDPIYHAELLLLRLAADGSPDPSFNAGLPRAVGDAVSSSARLLPQADGILLVGFGTQCCGNPSGFRALRLRADGSPDPAFGSGGELVVAPLDTTSSDVMSVPGGGFQILHNQPQRTFWRRYRRDGRVDTAFGINGEQDIPRTETFGIERLQELADGSWLGFTGYCPLRLFDAEGRVLSHLPGCAAYGAPFNMSSNFQVQLYGDRWLISGEQRFQALPPPSDGTYLFATDHALRIDREFAGTPDGRFRPPDVPTASYAVAADGDSRVVIARSSDNGVRVWRYRELRGGGPLSQPVPAAGATTLMLLATALAAVAAVRLRRGSLA
ncbi:hypothetical protein [Tahibacter caeni]|uniref:hypothetical protein n=1 Tax=Tahibacter caeni TaxID=1453545 RepID=UPI0021495806|nr:hypothetical protein [Tahibacter caeni]